MFCTDTDLLRWEPALFVEAAFAAQTVLVADGTFDGSLLRLRGEAWFDVARVRCGHVALIKFDGAQQGWPITSIDAPTVATLSGWRPRKKPAGRDVRVVVRTFAAQRRIAGELLARMAGIDPLSSVRVVDPEVLRRPAVLGTLQMIYGTLSASATSDDADLLVRMELYTWLYRQSLRGLVVEVTHCDERDARRPVGFVRYAAT